MARVKAISPIDLALNPRGRLVGLRFRGRVCGRAIIEIVGVILCPSGRAVGKPGGALLIEALRRFGAMRNRLVYSRWLAIGRVGVASGFGSFRRSGCGSRRGRVLGGGLRRRLCAACWAGDSFGNRRRLRCLFRFSVGASGKAQCRNGECKGKNVSFVHVKYLNVRAGGKGFFCNARSARSISDSQPARLLSLWLPIRQSPIRPIRWQEPSYPPTPRPPAARNYV